MNNFRHFLFEQLQLSLEANLYIPIIKSGLDIELLEFVTFLLINYLKKLLTSLVGWSFQKKKFYCRLCAWIQHYNQQQIMTFPLLSKTSDTAIEIFNYWFLQCSNSTWYSRQKIGKKCNKYLLSGVRVNVRLPRHLTG